MRATLIVGVLVLLPGCYLGLSTYPTGASESDDGGMDSGLSRHDAGMTADSGWCCVGDFCCMDRSCCMDASQEAGLSNGGGDGGRDAGAADASQPLRCSTASDCNADRPVCDAHGFCAACQAATECGLRGRGPDRVRAFPDLRAVHCRRRGHVWRNHAGL
jgi:hypothetical protein